MALILYCCENCAENNEESCGYFDPNEVRVMPDGRWLCDGCYSDCRTDIYAEQLRANPDFETPSWAEHPAPRTIDL